MSSKGYRSFSMKLIKWLKILSRHWKCSLEGRGREIGSLLRSTRQARNEHTISPRAAQYASQVTPWLSDGPMGDQPRIPILRSEDCILLLSLLSLYFLATLSLLFDFFMLFVKNI